jgi:hypothetical protein
MAFGHTYDFTVKKGRKQGLIWEVPVGSITFKRTITMVRESRYVFSLGEPVGRITVVYGD